MNKRRMILLLSGLLCVLLVGGMLLAQKAVAGSPQAVKLAGGHYQLVAHPDQAAEAPVFAGGRYRLESPAAPDGGCCCTFMPCVVKRR